ncbi:MAG: hypothetical protein KDB53_03920 [Planctomycetes bacterium]|nr:hypothetical protein [Planctomycetota bacterium]
MSPQVGKTEDEGAGALLPAVDGVASPATAMENLPRIQRIRPEIAASVLDTQHFLLAAAPERAWAAIVDFASGLTGSSEDERPLG